MKRKRNKPLSAALSILMLGSLAAGCASGDKEEAKPNTTAEKKDITISYYTPLNVNASAAVKSLGEVEMYKELEKRTGVKVNFKHPAVGQEKEQFNLMLASNNLTDVIEMGWGGYPGGPSKAIADGTIIQLNELIEKNAPNLSKILKERPDVAKMVRTDNGDIYAMPSLNLGKYRSFDGAFFRKDWLDELGLKTPETIAEWETALRAFKEKKGATSPLTTNLQKLYEFLMLPGAFGVTHSYYLDNGKVKYGVMEQGYKEYLTLMNKWFKEGLMDPDTFANDNKKIEANMVNGNSGLIFGYIGGTQGTLTNAGRIKGGKFELIGAQYPVLKAGDTPKFVARGAEFNAFGQVAITKVNKNPAETVKWLDYMYGPEGNQLKNFGIEGLTFKLEGGKPTYTDLVMKNPDKLSVAQAMAKYFRANYPSPGLQEDAYIEQYYELPEQRESAKTFGKYADLSLKTLLPPITPTPEEAQELARIEGEVKTYVDEMVTKFIMGVESLDKYDKFVEQLKKMKADRAIELRQAAYDRYLKR